MNSPKIILLMEDDEQRRKVLETAIAERFGPRCTIEVDGLGMLAQFIRERPDLIVVGDMWEKMTSHAVVHSLRQWGEVGKGVPIIVVSRSELTRAQAVKEGAAQFVTADDLPLGLTAALDRLFGVEMRG